MMNETEANSFNRDRLHNFTNPVQESRGSRAPSVAIKDLVGYWLGVIRENLNTSRDVLPMIFRGHNSVEVVEQVRRYFRQHPNLNTQLGWPQGDPQLPFISVVLTSRSTADGESYLGNNVGTDYSDPQRPLTLYQVPKDCKISLICSTIDANFAVYLGEIVEWILRVNQTEMEAYLQIGCLTTTAQDVRWTQEYLPKFCYMHAITVSCRSQFDWAVEEGVIRGFIVDFFVNGLLVKSVSKGPLAP